MNRKTLLAGAVFAGILGVTLLVLREPEKGTRTGEGPRPIAEIKEGSVDTLEVTKDGKTTVIKKEGDTYRVDKPVAYAADQDSAKEAFEAIEKMDFGNQITDQKSKHDEFEVGEKGVRVVAKDDGKVLADLRVGKTANAMTMVRVEGKDVVWQARGSIKFQFDKEPAAWRDKSITTFDREKAERLEVASAGGEKIVLSRPPKGDAGAEPEWKVVESTVKLDNFDKTVASDMISALYSFKANDFADGVPVTETGLASPALTVTVGLADGKKRTVLIGSKKGEEDYYVKTADGPQIFLVKKYNLERINRRPVEFRDKTICDLTEGEITQVAVQGKESFVLSKDPKKSGNEAWKLAKPKGELDTSKVSSILSAFKDWKAKEFAESDAPAATGLKKPDATVIASSNVKGHGCSLKVGKETEDKQNKYVAVAGRPDVYVVPTWSLDRVLQKVDDLKKK